MLAAVKMAMWSYQKQYQDVPQDGDIVPLIAATSRPGSKSFCLPGGALPLSELWFFPGLLVVYTVSFIHLLFWGKSKFSFCAISRKIILGV